MKKRNAALYLILLAYAQFVILGLPTGFLGAAWPSIQREFGLSIDAVGFYLLATTASYTLSSFFNGQITNRLGFGRSLGLAAVVYGLGFLGIGLAPSWLMMIAFGLLSGFGGGIIDAGLNRFLAARSRAILINWLHASYGLGATIGPVIMSAMLGAGLGWRTGYLGMLALQAILAILVLAARNLWEASQEGTATAELIQPAEKVSVFSTLRFPVVWLALLGFIIYCGAEGSVGQWAYSLFTIQRGVPVQVAGYWTSLYWGSFTIGRLFLGAVVDRFGTVRALRFFNFTAILGAALLWWNPVNEVGFLGLAIIGFSFAPYFASMIAYTPRLVGQRLAANVIGMQVGAGSLGIAGLPWLAGILAAGMGLNVVGPFLLVTVLALVLVFEVLVGRDWQAQRAAEGAPLARPD
jgi:fucose permease